MKKLFSTVIVVLLAVSFLFADSVFVQSELYPNQQTKTFAQQLNLEDKPAFVPENATTLASGNVNYPVTPGDVYILSYYNGTDIVSETISVDSLMNVQIPFSGKINAGGKTFIELKKLIETSVSSIYPYAKPQLIVERCGIFSVPVSGQVKYSQEVQVWGMTRLSDLSWYATEWASSRDVEVTYEDGTTKSYDLFNALFNAKSEDNPILPPGCSVKYKKAVTTVTLNGFTRKTGTFQTLKNETLADLVNYYGQGLLNNAETDQITVSRFQNGKFETVMVSWKDASKYILKDGDNVNVKNAMQSMPYIVIEGAVGTSTDSQSNKIFYQFFPGETAEDLIRGIKDRFTAASDTKAIYLTRENGEKISLNADLILSSNEPGKTELKSGDVISVPFAKQTVVVNGAVVSPGSFAYSPNKNYEYYINLAGGFTTDAKRLELKIYNSQGIAVSRNNVVPSDSVISVPRSTFSSNVSLITAVIGMVTAGLALFTALSK